jgi:hypothetical protein
MSSEAPTTPIPPAVDASGGAFSRVFRVFTDPTGVFNELAVTPTWLPPLLVILVLSVAMQLVVSPRLDLEGTIRQSITERSESGQQMSDEQIERMVEMGTKTAGVMRWLTPVTVPLIFLLVGGIYFLGLKATGSSTEFKPVFATTLHANVPAALLSSAVMAAAVLRRATFTAQELESMVKSNLGAFLPDTVPKPLVAFAGVIDIFNIWQWILLAIGLPIVAKVSRGKAVAVLAVVWGVWALGKMGLAALQ